MATMTDHTTGLDISRSRLEGFRWEDGAAPRLDDPAAGFQALTRWLNWVPAAGSGSTVTTCASARRAGGTSV